MPALVLVLVAAMSLYRPRGLARVRFGKCRNYFVMTLIGAGSSDQAVLQSLQEGLARKISTDEDHLACRFLARLPSLSVIGTHHLVDALKNQTSIGTLDKKDAFIPQHILTVNLNQTP